MSILNSIYYRLHRLFSKPSERGEYSSGLWQDRIRACALELCAGVSGRALEIGCGEGLFLVRLKQREPVLDVWGIDSDSGRLARAEERARGAGLEIHVSRADAAGLSFGDGYFDLVVCVNVFFNLDSLATVRKVLGEMKRVCKNGGKIVFDYRNSRNLLLRIKYGLAPWYDATIRDIPLRMYSPEEIGNLLREEGFTRVISRPVGFSWKRYAPIIMVEAGV